jgi:hypothetical protein
MTATKNMSEGVRSCTIRYKSSAMMTRQGMPPQTSLTHHHKWYKAALSSQGSMMTHRSLLPASPLSTALSKSRVTTLACTPSMILKPALMPHHLLQMWPSYSSFGTPIWAWCHLKNQTSLHLPNPQCHMSHIPVYPHLILTTDHIHQPRSSLRNQELYQEMTGSAMLKDSHQCMTILSPGWEKG